MEPSHHRTVEVHELILESGHLVFLFHVNIDKHSELKQLYEDVLKNFDDEFFKDINEPFPDRTQIEVRYETELKEAGYHALPMSYEAFTDVLSRIVLIVYD